MIFVAPIAALLRYLLSTVRRGLSRRRSRQQREAVALSLATTPAAGPVVDRLIRRLGSEHNV
jgi:hypothetical protein